MTPPSLHETVRKVVAYGSGLGAVAGIAYLGEQGHDGGLIKDVWAAAKTASPFAAMLCIMLLADERRERRSAQQQCADRTIDFIKAVNQGYRAIEKMADAVEKRRNR